MRNEEPEVSAPEVCECWLALEAVSLVLYRCCWSTVICKCARARRVMQPLEVKHTNMFVASDGIGGPVMFHAGDRSGSRDV